MTSRESISNISSCEPVNAQHRATASRAFSTGPWCYGRSVQGRSATGAQYKAAVLRALSTGQHYCRAASVLRALSTWQIAAGLRSVSMIRALSTWRITAGLRSVSMLRAIRTGTHYCENNLEVIKYQGIKIWRTNYFLSRFLINKPICKSQQSGLLAVFN